MAGYIKNGDGTYSINYEDQRFKDIKTEQAQKEAQTSKNYDTMINDSTQYYQNQIDAAQNYAKQQSELQQAQTNFALEQIEQQKEQTEKDYIREQKASYTDYQKESNRYGVNAEQLAASGLTNTGYGETSRTSMYITYQNRVASARETYNQAVLNYNNQARQAELSNNETLAEIAYNALQTQLQLSQQAFEYKNTLVLAKEEALERLNEVYYARYQDVINQINNEIDLQMQVDKINREYEQWIKQMELEVAKLEEQKRMNNAQIANLQVEAEYKRAQIANINAQTAYTKARSNAVTSSSNPYSNTSNSATLSSKAQSIYEKTLSTAKAMTTSEGKQKARDVIANELSKSLAKNVITDSEMQYIANKVYKYL